MLYTFAAFITNTTRRTAVISWSGLPSVAMMRALEPGAIVLRDRSNAYAE
jgi:hypothetical protein